MSRYKCDGECSKWIAPWTNRCECKHANRNFVVLSTNFELERHTACNTRMPHTAHIWNLSLIHKLIMYASHFRPGSNMVFGLFDSPVPYRGQEFAALQKAAQDSGHLFVDELFPADNSSLFSANGKNASKLTGIQWKRPKV